MTVTCYKVPVSPPCVEKERLILHESDGEEKKDPEKDDGKDPNRSQVHRGYVCLFFLRSASNCNSFCKSYELKFQELL